MKKEILMGLGSNPTILNGKLAIQAHEWLVPIQNDYPALEKKYKRLELDKMPMNTTKKEALASIRQSWLGRRVSCVILATDYLGILPAKKSFFKATETNLL
jgi:hypothetical protein